MSTQPPPISDQPVLKLLNVESAYGPIKAIRGVSLQVRRGEIATVLGSNGAGKTTILKTISGIIDPRKGSVEFKGQDITARDPAYIVQEGLSHVPEGREVFPLLSVRDNLLMGAYTRKDSDGVAKDIEAVFGYFPILKERAAQDAGLLSGGQQQMLSISRALIRRSRRRRRRPRIPGTRSRRRDRPHTSAALRSACSVSATFILPVMITCSMRCCRRRMLRSAVAQ